MTLSQRVKNIEESKTTKFTGLLQAMRNEGRTIINLAVGEPHFDTPAEIIESTKEALNDQKTRYCPVQGISELQSAIGNCFEGYDPENIVITNGSKQALYSIFQIICDPSDEVIIPKPCWVSLPEQVKLAGANPVLVDTSSHQLDFSRIEAAITDNTKAILINSPNNPTGAVYSPADLARLAAIAREHDLYVISDEAYHFFVYDGLTPSSIIDFEEFQDRLIITRSFSKHYHMTGYRIGYVVAAREIIQAIVKLQSHVSGNVCTFVQYGALSALQNENQIFSRHRVELEKNRDIAYEYANRMFNCIKPQGAFYVFPDISGHLSNGATAEDFAGKLLRKTGVAVVPGEAFGVADHIRISYAVPEALLREGLDKIAEVL